MANLATIYFNQCQWDETAEIILEVKQTITQVLGEQHPDTLASTANLASAYFSLIQWANAENVFVEVQRMSEKLHGKEHPSTLMVLSNLAIVVRLQGRAEEAISWMETCIELRERSLDNDHPVTQQMRQILADWREEDLSTR